jgi:hypothetical protein
VRRPGLLTLSLLAAAVVPRLAGAQSSGLMTVLVEVANDPLTIQPFASLDFGQLVHGTPTAIAPRTSASVGKFEIRGVRRAEFTLDFTLPTLLRAGNGPHTIPLTFGWSAACHATQDNQNACSLIDPSVTLTARIRNQAPPDNTHYVWLGGTVTPSPTQFPGVYTAVVIATVQYTGN